MDFPIKITAIALGKLLEAQELDEDIDESFGVRISCRYGGCAGYRHDLDFDDEARESDIVETFVLKQGQVKVIIDPDSSRLMQGVTLNHVSSDFSEGFKFEGGELFAKACACGESVSYCSEETNSD